MKPMRVLLIGAAGRMGQAIEAAAAGESKVEIVARCQAGDALEELIGHCDVVIDFSHASATERNCAVCLTNAKPLVIGTTGQSVAQQETIDETAKTIPVLLAPNFSVGVNALFSLARKAAELLGDSFDVEIIETHHRLKKDAPSGTAKRLAQVVSDVRGFDEKNLTHGRTDLVGERPQNEIGIHAIRAGDVVGDHTVLFATEGERLELTHKASSRATFALGALRAARWIIDRPAGLYNMEDVLGL